MGARCARRLPDRTPQQPTQLRAQRLRAARDASVTASVTALRDRASLACSRATCAPTRLAVFATDGSRPRPHKPSPQPLAWARSHAANRPNAYRNAASVAMAVQPSIHFGSSHRARATPARFLFTRSQAALCLIIGRCNGCGDSPSTRGRARPCPPDIPCSGCNFVAIPARERGEGDGGLAGARSGL